MRKKICFILMIGWMAVIFAFSSRNAELSTQDSTSIGMFLGMLILPTFQDFNTTADTFADMVDHPVRKLAHVTEYAVLGALIAGSYVDEKRKRKDILRVPILIGCIYAVSDEVHQMFVPGRSCQLSDMLIDSCGVMIGVLFVQLLWKWNRHKDS